ncbi:MAG TPA: response regulator [Blastocatellia bacterium]
MEAVLPDLTPSGVEPIDRLLGGLQKGKLYLAYGDGFAKSLIGLRFLIEGLRQGESAALVTDYSAEDAVRRFARLGYDCLEKIYSGQLIVLEFGDDNVKQIARMPDLAPVLKELRWLMGESAPGRVVFEPIARLIIGEAADLTARTRQFANWAEGIGSTTLFVSGITEPEQEVIDELRPHLAESFSVSTDGQTEKTTGVISFEKSGGDHSAAIEVDQTQGIFLADRHQTGPLARPIDPVETHRVQRSEGLAIEPAEPVAAPAEKQPIEQKPEVTFDDLLAELESRPDIHTAATAAGALSTPEPDANALVAPPVQPPAVASSPGPASNITSASPAPIEPRPKHETAPLPPPHPEDPPAWYQGLPNQPGSPPAPEPGITQRPAPAFDLTQMTADELLRPPRNGQKSPDREADGAVQRSGAKGVGYFPPSSPPPGSFSVLIVTGDQSCHKRIVKALRDYSLDRAANGISGLAKLISSRPDLVVLDADLQIVNGFEVLEHMRANLDVPIIVLSSSYMRASDRIQWTEQGADYYLSKPFSISELRHKARQLIARYRGIDEWITGGIAPVGGHSRSGDPDREETAVDARAFAHSGGKTHGFAKDLRSNPVGREAAPVAQVAQQVGPASSIEMPLDRPPSPPQHTGSNNGHYLPYHQFVKQVEDRVKQAIEDESWFCIVGCRARQPGEARPPVKNETLVSLIGSLVRQGDVMSVNAASDILIMLADANAAGAKAFLARLRSRVGEVLDREPTIWMRQYPLPETADA